MDPIPAGARVLRVLDGNLFDHLDGADGIVSSDDNYLTHGGGISREIWRRLALQPPEPRPRLELGDVFAQPAPTPGSLRWVFHAITIDFDRAERVSRWAVADLYARVLARAAENGCRVLAMPLLAAGAAGLSAGDSLDALLDALEACSVSPTSLVEVRVAVLDRDGWDAEAHLRQRGPLASPGLPPALLAAALQQVVHALAGQALARWNASGSAEGIDGVAGLPPSCAWSPALGSVSLRHDLERAEHLNNRAGGKLDAATRADLWSAVKGVEALGSGRASTGVASQLLRTLGRIEAARPDLYQSAIGGLTGGAAASALAGSGLATAVAGSSLAVGSLAVGGMPILGLIGGIAGLARLVASRFDGAAPSTVGAAPPEELAAPPPSSPRSAAAAGEGTAHVRRLAEFLLKHLGAEELEELLEQLDSEGYRGERDVRLLEFCVRSAEPVALLTDRFTAARLRKLLRAESGQDGAGKDHAGLAEAVLAHLGFPRNERPRGLKAAREQVAALHASVKLVGTIDEIAGLVTRADGVLDEVAIVLLRFVCRFVVGQAAEPWMLERGLIQPGRVLAKCTTGTLMEALARLSTEVATLSLPVGSPFARAFTARPLVPPSVRELAKHRNRVVHREVTTLAASRQEAILFLEGTLSLLDHLAGDEHRVFPIIVTVDRIVIDRWGRRVVEATSEDKEERLFTDEHLKAGEVYYMHPISNPFRVDPVLMPRGDLA